MPLDRKYFDACTIWSYNMSLLKAGHPRLARRFGAAAPLGMGFALGSAAFTAFVQTFIAVPHGTPFAHASAADSIAMRFLAEAM